VAEATGGVQEQGGPDHPRLVVAALVPGPLLGGRHCGGLVGARGPFLKIAWTHLGLASSGKGLSATTWASSAQVRTMTVGRTPRCLAMARSSAAAILAVSASSLVKITLPL
jgi:hypothetical protein